MIMLNAVKKVLSPGHSMGKNDFLRAMDLEKETEIEVPVRRFFHQLEFNEVSLDRSGRALVIDGTTEQVDSDA